MWIPVGSAVAIILLSLGVLEVMSEGVRVDQSSTGARRFWETPAHSGPAFLDTPDDLLTLEFGPAVSRETPEGLRPDAGSPPHPWVDLGRALNLA